MSIPSSNRASLGEFEYCVAYFITEVYRYVATLPASARPHLELQLDWGHGGVETDLCEIAHVMLDWEVKLSTHLGLTEVDLTEVGLTEVDVHDITRGISNLELQRCVQC